MALMMIFSTDSEEKYKAEAMRLGFDYYQTDNIYQFLRYAKEAKPDVAVLNFKDDFNNDYQMMNEIYGSLCEKNICPKIYLNQPQDFSGNIFFENVDFKEDDSFFKSVKNQNLH